MYYKIRLEIPEYPEFHDVKCQHCNHVVEQKVSREALRDLIFYCPKCGSYVET